MAASSSSGTTGTAGTSSPYPGLASTSISGLLGAYTQYQAGKATASIERFNASVADMNARRAIQAGVFGSNRALAAGRRLVGEQRAALAGQGVVVDNGTGAVLVDQGQADAHADALTIRNNAYLEAWGFQTTARADRFKADQARRAGTQGAIGSLLTTAARIGDFSNRADLGQGT